MASLYCISYFTAAVRQNRKQVHEMQEMNFVYISSVSRNWCLKYIGNQPPPKKQKKKLVFSVERSLFALPIYARIVVIRCTNLYATLHLSSLLVLMLPTALLVSALFIVVVIKFKFCRLFTVIASAFFFAPSSVMFQLWGLSSLLWPPYSVVIVKSL